MRRRYRRARSQRAAWDALWQDCYDYALPLRRPNAGAGGQIGAANAMRAGDKLFDGTAADAVDQLAAGRLAQLTPPWALVRLPARPRPAAATARRGRARTRCRGAAAAAAVRSLESGCRNAVDPNRAKRLLVDERDAAFRLAREIAAALAGSLRDVTGKATHYHARHLLPGWAKGRTPSAMVGRHAFCNDIA